MVDVEADDVAVLVEIDESPSTISRVSTPGTLLSSM